MTRITAWRVSALLALATAAAMPTATQAATALQVALSAPQAVVQGTGSVDVEVTITNTSHHRVKVLRWQLPEGELQGPLFRVTRADGRPATYLGPLVKRAAPQASDYVRLAPGESRSYQVDLGSRYDLGDGQYQVQYLGRAGQAGQADVRSTRALTLWTSARPSALRTPPADDPEDEPAQDQAQTQATTGSVSYVSCSAARRTKLVTAVADASSYASNAVTYLKALRAAKPRYTTWFGAYDNTRRTTVLGHYQREVTAFTTKALKLDCSCTESGTYAYVYPTSPYRIYLCGAFWTAPAKGTDSKAGTLVHEMSHFTVVADTEDHAYGQDAAKALALSDPLQAIANADSHEYFAENTPAQR